ncbi:MAG: Mur ligase family protein [Erythrobacter sp.]
MTEGSDQGALSGRSFFFCGIGGSGMLPLAQILAGLGYEVAGSDRSHDQGRTPEKFAWLAQNGFDLFPQDGSGLTSADQVLVASAAVEDTVPDAARAKELGCERMSRAEVLAQLFNQAGYSIAIGGTSGKSTVTGMIGTILAANGSDPTIMNGAVMKNFVNADNPFASARVGRPEVFVSEVDESDGSIALYRPTIGVLLNVSLDHKSMDELRELFGDFLKTSGCGAVNFDNDEARQLAGDSSQVISFGVENRTADIIVEPGSITQSPFGIAATVHDNRTRESCSLNLPMPGLHNLSNALAAIAAASAAGIAIESSVQALQDFAGLARRFDVIGTTATGIAVIDDFGHNPEKCAATLRTLKATPGRIIAFFQPHGYGPLRQMGDELAQTFAQELAPEDRIIMCDPVYFGGTVDRSEGTERIIKLIKDAGGSAEHVPAREECSSRMLDLAQPNDRIVIMGARDDTLTSFAKELFQSLTAAD